MKRQQHGMVASRQAATDRGGERDRLAARAARPAWWHYVLLAGVLAADTAIIAAAVAGHLGFVPAAAAHVAVVAIIGLAAVLVKGTGGDRTMLSLAAVTTACIGPLGTLGALIVALLAPARNATTPLLEAWYQRIAHSVETDPDAQLCNMVAIGRAIDLTGGPPPSFAHVMTHGSLAERQTLLGHIARNFDVTYLHALKIAMTNPEPVIRVQAAAVATRVQTVLSRIVARWEERTKGPLDSVEALGAIEELEACLGSGLIEASDRARAEAALRLAGEQAGAVLADASGFRQRLLAGRNELLVHKAVAGFERMLVRERHFRDLRNWRRVQRAGMHRAYRLRPCRVRRRPRAAVLRETAR